MAEDESPAAAPGHVRCIVSGRVQGVWFRAATADRARALALRGFVRNRSDGSVEVVLGGDEPAVREMIGWLWEGPERARVTGVEVAACDEPLPPTFEVAPTL